MQRLSSTETNTKGHHAPLSDALIETYKAMLRVRRFDQKCVALQRVGKIGTYPSCEGAEAIGTAIARAMKTDDVLVPYYRDQASQLVRGVTMLEQLRYWGGFEAGNNFQNCPEDFPSAIPIASQCPQACGVASAMKIRREKRACVCTLGDGATSKGDFAEALNVAGVWQLPVVFVINTNQWAISVPRYLQCRAEKLTDKGLAAGIEGCQVDATDVEAIFAACDKALNRARAGKGPGLIECVGLRLCDHTTADDASRYRGQLDELQHQRYDPLIQFEQRYPAIQEYKPNFERDIDSQIQQALRDYELTETDHPEALLGFLYERNSVSEDQLEQLTNKQIRLQQTEGAGGSHDSH